MQTVREVSSFPAESGMVGKSSAFSRMLELIRRVAPSNTAALLLGESGTAKELVAQAIHQQSGREYGPFMVVECLGLTETLFESELFGYEKGAFTGANQRKIGLVESASGGTLFLNEVGDIPLGLQVKLLPELEGDETAGMPSVDEIVPLETAELRYLQWALAHHGGDRKSLAAQLGISEWTLYRKLAPQQRAFIWSVTRFLRRPSRPVAWHRKGMSLTRSPASFGRTVSTSPPDRSTRRSCVRSLQIVWIHRAACGLTGRAGRTPFGTECCPSWNPDALPG